MSITVLIKYRGKHGAARAFGKEMIESGTVDAIRSETGNEQYGYYIPLESNDRDDEVLLIDRWRDQAALDAHHSSPMMGTIAKLRDKYDLHMEVERFDESDDDASSADERFIRR